ncbi:MAG: metallophosphoesterase [Candidatus Heimdallarchaeota archaeon]|nr:metallophosphoesterase [Candidatus Heimdallarchaeota archaeon]MCK4876566.1 metallophosphoesterase [Candidatus Heimdallarchaeota archaeon]
MDITKKLRKLIAEGYQLTPDAYSFLASLENSDLIIEKILSTKIDKFILSLEDIKQIQNKDEEQVSIKDIKQESKLKKDEKSSKTPSDNEVQQKTKDKKKSAVISSKKEKISADLQIIYQPDTRKSPASAQSFSKYFESRYDLISGFFTRRKDITNRVSTDHLDSKASKDKVSFLAMVSSKQKTRKGNVILELEDKHGSITGIIMNSNVDLIQKAEFILEDSVLCFLGKWNKEILNVNDVLWPDIPFNHKPHKSAEEVLALFISDIHVGSKNFAGELFLRLIKFINGQLESEKHNQIGENIKYIFVGGDVVDGVGVYPGQADDLLLENIQLQYLLAAEYFEQIRSDVEIVIIPGNHDAARSAEPQTPIQKEFAPELHDLDNVHLLGSPAYLKAHNVEILMSHGNSIMDINAAIPAIHHETSMPAMVEMLKNRHLVPIYGRRTPIAPEPVDQLVISKIPDIFQTGHTHIAGDETYKGVTLINSGTFQYQTSYQKSMNINPTTGKTYLINLRNLQRTIIDFNEIS